MTKEMKNNTEVGATTKQAKKRERSTTLRDKGLDLPKFTPEYFYFDILNEDIDKIKIPTIAELTFLGKLNASSIRSYFRGEEKKLNKWVQSLQSEIDQLKIAGPRLGVLPECNWHGYSFVYPDLCEEASKDHRVCHMDYEKTMKMIGSCKFGRDVAHWCEKNHSAHCDHQCIDYEGIIAYSPLITGEVGRPDKLWNLNLQEVARTNTEGHKCQFYDLCHGTQPFADEACVLADSEKQAECTEFLKAKLTDVRERLKILKKYLSSLTKVVQNCDPCYNRPEFFDGNNYSGSGNAKALAIIRRTPDGVVAGLGFHCETEPGLDGHRPAVVAEVTDDGIVKHDVRRESTAKLYMSLDNFMYLLKHKDFCQVWIRMSCRQNMPFTVEELTKLFAAEIHWVDKPND